MAGINMVADEPVRERSDVEHWWYLALREAIRADEPDYFMDLLTSMRGVLTDRQAFVLLVLEVIHDSVNAKKVGR